MSVHPKKSLGQHFLIDENIAGKIVGSLDLVPRSSILEIGAGTGMLTKYLFDLEQDVSVMEIDREAYAYLLERFPSQTDRILHGDFLKSDLSEIFEGQFSIIGNFPYHISSQIFFRILDRKNDIRQVVCMIQKEVADRVRAAPGSRTYGILSVLLQTFYDIEYLFKVGPGVFNPPPKVLSAVIRLQRNERKELPCNEKLYYSVIKSAFNQRRKMLRNSLKSGFKTDRADGEMLKMRPEQLGVQQFIELTLQLETDNSL